MVSTEITKSFSACRECSYLVKMLTSLDNWRK